MWWFIACEGNFVIYLWRFRRKTVYGLYNLPVARYEARDSFPISFSRIIKMTNFQQVNHVWTIKEEIYFPMDLLMKWSSGFFWNHWWKWSPPNRFPLKYLSVNIFTDSRNQWNQTFFEKMPFRCRHASHSPKEILISKRKITIFQCPPNGRTFAPFSARHFQIKHEKDLNVRTTILSVFCAYTQTFVELMESNIITWFRTWSIRKFIGCRYDLTR